jgi:LacI family transcriptional regulator
VIFPDIENPFYPRVLTGISQVAEKSQYNVFLFNSDETSRRERQFLEVIRQQRLDGVIIGPADGYNKELISILTGFESQGVGVVLLDRDLDGADFSCVRAENEKGSYLAVRQLLLNGHTRIGMIEGDPIVRPVSERTTGYLQALGEFHIPIISDYIVRSDMKSEMAYWATKKLMDLEEPPTAIFTCNNMITLGCIRYLTDNKIRVGRDISLIGFDEIETFKLIGYNLSVVDRSEHEMGRKAMQLLLERIEHPEIGTRTEIIPTRLILRGSEKLSG